MCNRSRLLQPLKCQWNPTDALINLFTHNLHSPPAPLKAVSQYWWFRMTNWSALHKHVTEYLNGQFSQTPGDERLLSPVRVSFSFYIDHLNRDWKLLLNTVQQRFCKKCIYWFFLGVLLQLLEEHLEMRKEMWGGRLSLLCTSQKVKNVETKI